MVTLRLFTTFLLAVLPVSCLFASNSDIEIPLLKFGLESKTSFENALAVSDITTVNDANDSEIEKKDLKRRRSRAFLRSVLVPGWGQIAENKRSLGYTFMTAEALLITGIIGLRTHASWLEEDYKTLADQHAGIDGSFDHQYYVDIGNWMTSIEYNEQRLRDRYYDAVYTDSKFDWSWDSDSNRRKFREMRIASDNSRQMSILLVGGIVLNHFISAIEAGRGIKADKAQSSTINIDYNSRQDVMLNFSFYPFKDSWK